MMPIKNRMRNNGNRSYRPHRIAPQPACGKPKIDQIIPALQEQNRLQQQQLQQQALLAQSGFGSPAGGTGVGAAAAVAAVAGGVINMPSYADQMQAAFLDYQRQREEFEKQQHQLLQKLYQNYPEVPGAQPQALQQQQQQHPVKSHPGAAGGVYPYQRPQVGNNGLQSGAGSLRPGARSGPHPAMGAGDFYSTQQHMGFMQQQQQDVLREQQQLVAQQFATSQMAPTTRQSFGMAVPMSSVLSAPSFPPSSDAAHVGFPSGSLNHGF
ncbi:hypothetical protein KR054_000107 [Drosophila jambulina]|nr:hypothetical protein KR054_000107 [Drosophila jambulina]